LVEERLKDKLSALDTKQQFVDILGGWTSEQLLLRLVGRAEFRASSSEKVAQRSLPNTKKAVDGA